MGILNATPNSFYNRGRGSNLDALIATAEKMITDGAVILDLGGASSKPGEPLISADEETTRIIPLVCALSQRFPGTWLSVDTYNATVARESVYAGAHIVNDISAGEIDRDMLAVVAALGVPYIAMHMQGLPANMQQNPHYDNAAQQVTDYLAARLTACRAAGIHDVIIDPGFGFGKTVAHNFELLAHLTDLHVLGRPVLAGLSRKSLICRPLGVTPEHALNGTTALNMAALERGAAILRVHDVREAAETIRLFQELSAAGIHLNG
jgi:dihydropteroate synthase